jgi:hypothetical protein
MLPAVVCLVSALATLSASGGATAPCVWQAAGPASRIVGRVIDPKSRAGMGSVRVRLDGDATEVVTGADGSFEFPGIAAGPHRLVAVLDGFAASTPVDLTVAEGADARVEFEYALSLTTEVRGAAAPPASLPAAALGSSTLSGRQVASAIGALDDVVRTMQLRPGVAASEDDRNDLIVRGGGAYETAVRMDGFELPTASHFAWPGGASGGLSLVPSAVIGEASIETSGFSVAFGERASALFNVETRRAGDARVSGQSDVSAGGVLGLLEGRLPWHAGSWLVSARRSILEIVFSRGDSQATPSYADVIAKLDLTLSRVHHARLLVVGASDGLDVNWSSTSNRIRGDQDMGLVGVALRSAWTPRTETSLLASASTNEGTLQEAAATPTRFSEHSRERLLRLRAEVRRTLATRLQATAGVAFKQSNFAFALQDGSYRNEYGILVPAVRSNLDDEAADVAGYVELAAVPVTALRVVVGGRVERSGITSSWYASPRARVEYSVRPRWRVIGTAGIYRQDIPLIWIGSDPANRSLDPVRCLQTTAGLEGDAWRGSRFTVEAFVKRYRGYPVDPVEPARVLISAGADFESPLVGRLVPAGLVHASGADLSVVQRLPVGLDVAVVYSYWRETEFNLDNQWIPADYDLRHQGRVWVAWHGARRWSASLLWRYASGRPYTPYDVKASIKANAGRYDRTRNNGATYPPYHRLDVRAERLFLVGRRAVTAFFEVDNLYDRDNLYMYDWSKSARQAQPAYQWGLTPVAGVRFQF